LGTRHNWDQDPGVRRERGDRRSKDTVAVLWLKVATKQNKTKNQKPTQSSKENACSLLPRSEKFRGDELQAWLHPGLQRTVVSSQLSFHVYFFFGQGAWP
jgi:hypothetical protein